MWGISMREMEITYHTHSFFTWIKFKLYSGGLLIAPRYAARFDPACPLRSRAAFQSDDSPKHRGL